MNAVERRQEIVRLITTNDEAMSGSMLAKELDVSRQVIVQDIALLKAAGYEILSTKTGILVHGNLHVVAVLLYCGQRADLIQAALPGLTRGHSAVQGNGAGVGHCAAAGGGEEDFGNRNGSTAQEVGFLVLGVVFLVQHFHKALYFLVVGSVVLVQSAHVLKDVGHLVDGVVAALRSGTVAGNALDVHTDLHAASLAAYFL